MAKGEKETCEQEVEEYLRIVLSTSTVFPPMIVESPRALAKTENEVKKLPALNHRPTIQVRMRT